MTNCEAMTSPTHSFEIHKDWSRNVFRKNLKFQNVTTSWISYPIFIIFAPICRGIFTLSFEIMLILDWTSPLIFFRVLGYAHKKSSNTKILVVTSLVNHHPVNIIISIDIAMSAQIVSAKVLCHNSIPQIHLRYLSFAGVLYHAIVREHLALAVQHTLVFWNDNVYWMVIDKWCHN